MTLFVEAATMKGALPWRGWGHGHIKTGKLANTVILERSAVENVGNFRFVGLIVKGWRIFPPEKRLRQATLVRRM